MFKGFQFLGRTGARYSAVFCVLLHLYLIYVEASLGTLEPLRGTKKHLVLAGFGSSRCRHLLRRQFQELSKKSIYVELLGRPGARYSAVFVLDYVGLSVI